MEGFNSHMCNVCGCESMFRCSSCQMAYYCSKVHQIEDWKKGHRLVLAEVLLLNLTSRITYPSGLFRYQCLIVDSF